MTWHPITGEEIAACFSEKKRGWRPTPEGCAAISARLNWLFLNALADNKPSNGNPQRPTVPDMGKAAEHARLLSREIDKAVEQLESVVSYEEGFGHREKGADPTRYSIEVLRDIKRAIETARPTLEPRKIKAGQAMAWRQAARAVYQVFSNADGSTPTVRGQEHLAGVIARLLNRAGLGDHTPAAVADACNDKKLDRVLIVHGSGPIKVMRLNR